MRETHHFKALTDCALGLKKRVMKAFMGYNPVKFTFEVISHTYRTHSNGSPIQK